MSTAAPKKTPPEKSKTSKRAPKPNKTDAPVSAVNGLAPIARQVEPVIVEGPQPVIIGPVMRKKELIETVVMRSGMKKKDVKPVVETMLSVLGEALLDNRELVLPPFGKLKVRRAKQLANARVMVAKIRQSANHSTAGAAKPSTTDET